MIKHKHHIIPRHAGGTDEPSNLVELTIEEHAEAHKILYEQYGRPEDKLAWQCLSGMLSKEEIISARMSLAGKIGGALGGRKGKGKKQTKDWIEKRKVFGEKNGMYGKSHTEEYKKNVSVKMKDYVKKMGDEFAGTKALKDSVKKRLEDGKHPSKFIGNCPHCGKEVKALGNYIRWHGDNCKTKE
jgi:hypothetical protein